MEKLFILVWTMRREQEYQQARAQIQGFTLLLEKPEAARIMEKVFADLREAYFPYDKKQNAQEVHELKKVLDREMAKGAIAVAPVEAPRKRRRPRGGQQPTAAAPVEQRPKGVFS